jgi:predicted dehydrogenase
MAAKIRWGIVGLGGIANKFAEALSFVEDAELIAVGSRSDEKAHTLGDRYKTLRCYSSYQELADDKDLDIIYIATPHNLHYENTIMSLNAGKAVLCEKPLAVNARQVGAMIDFAQERKLFLMEAMWTRFLPLMDKVRHLLAEGVIGEVRILAADFGFRSDGQNWKQRHRDPNLAGGALLDVGVYPLALSSMLFGRPLQIFSSAYFGETGVDEQNGIVLAFDKGQLSIIYSAQQTETPHEAAIMGTKGMLKLHRSWWKGNKLTLIRSGKDDQFIEVPSHNNGFVYEIKAAQKALQAGKLEADLMPLDESLSIMQTMDAIRNQWGFKYPFE